MGGVERIQLIVFTSHHLLLKCLFFFLVDAYENSWKKVRREEKTLLMRERPEVGCGRGHLVSFFN